MSCIATTEMRSWKTVRAPSARCQNPRHGHVDDGMLHDRLQYALWRMFFNLTRSAWEQPSWCWTPYKSERRNRWRDHSASRTLRTGTLTNQISQCTCLLFFLPICTWVLSHCWRKGRGTLPGITCGLSPQSQTNNQRFLSLPRCERQRHGQHPAGGRRSGCSVESCYVSTWCRGMSVICIAQARAAAKDGSPGAVGVKAEELLPSYTTNQGHLSLLYEDNPLDH